MPARGACSRTTRFTPGQPGWIEAVDQAIEVRQARRAGRATRSATLITGRRPLPYRLDDEKLMYPFYEKAVKAGIKNDLHSQGPVADVRLREWSLAGIWKSTRPSTMCGRRPRTGRSSISSSTTRLPPPSAVPRRGMDELEQDRLFPWVTDLAAHSRRITA